MDWAFLCPRCQHPATKHRDVLGLDYGRCDAARPCTDNDTGRVLTWYVERERVTQDGPRLLEVE